MYMLMSMTPQGADSSPFLSPFVQVPTCYRPLEPNVPQDYRRTFSYHNNIYQYPHWPRKFRSLTYTLIYLLVSD